MPLLRTHDVQLRTGNLAAVIESANAALELERGNVKALFRRGQAYLAQGDLAPAKADLMLAARTDPKNREIRQALEVLKLRQQEERDKEKAIYAGKLLW
jgi:tetratricopeptide (TPR) repeat protein